MEKKNGVRNCLGTVDEIRKVFSRFDKNGDNKISRDELKEVVRALTASSPSDEVSRMMKELDKDGDGFIDFDEFVSHFQVEGGGGGGDGEAEEEAAARDLKDAFDLYDMDGNGLISASELHSVMQRLGEKCSLVDCAKMIGQVDTDGDGFVSFEEFKKMMNAA